MIEQLLLSWLFYFYSSLWEPRIKGKHQLCCPITEGRAPAGVSLSILSQGSDRLRTTVSQRAEPVETVQRVIFQTGKLRPQRVKDFPKASLAVGSEVCLLSPMTTVARKKLDVVPKASPAASVSQ